MHTIESPFRALGKDLGFAQPVAATQNGHWLSRLPLEQADDRQRFGHFVTATQALHKPAALVWAECSVAVLSVAAAAYLYLRS